MAHEYDINKIKQNKDKEYSHYNLFDTLLGLFEVKTEVYKKELDILNEARKERLNKLYLQPFLLWAVILIFQFTDFDIEFQSIFYNFETKSWILSKDNYLADLIFYSGFKKNIYTICIYYFTSINFIFF